MKKQLVALAFAVLLCSKASANYTNPAQLLTLARPALTSQAVGSAIIRLQALAVANSARLGLAATALAGSVSWPVVAALGITTVAANVCLTYDCSYLIDFIVDPVDGTVSYKFTLPNPLGDWSTLPNNASNASLQQLFPNPPLWPSFYSSYFLPTGSPVYPQVILYRFYSVNCPASGTNFCSGSTAATTSMNPDFTAPLTCSSSNSCWTRSIYKTVGNGVYWVFARWQVNNSAVILQPAFVDTAQPPAYYSPTVAAAADVRAHDDAVLRITNAIKHAACAEVGGAFCTEADLTAADIGSLSEQGKYSPPTVGELGESIGTSGGVVSSAGTGLTPLPPELDVPMLDAESEVDASTLLDTLNEHYVGMAPQLELGPGSCPTGPAYEYRFTLGDFFDYETSFQETVCDNLDPWIADIRAIIIFICVLMGHVYVIRESA